MGTTLTLALIRDDTVLLGHVGDSRAYLLHEGALRQLTDDHSWVGEMVRRGELTEAEAAVHPHRSVITKALGTEGEAEPDLMEVALEPGDRLLLCSDGLSGMVSSESIEEVLRRPDGAQAVADALVEAALKGGGEDNVTVVVVDLVADEGLDVAPEDVRTDSSRRRGRCARRQGHLGPYRTGTGAQFRPRLHAPRSGHGRQVEPPSPYLGEAGARGLAGRLRSL